MLWQVSSAFANTARYKPSTRVEFLRCIRPAPFSWNTLRYCSTSNGNQLLNSRLLFQFNGRLYFIHTTHQTCLVIATINSRSCTLPATSNSADGCGALYSHDAGKACSKKPDFNTQKRMSRSTASYSRRFVIKSQTGDQEFWQTRCSSDSPCEYWDNILVLLVCNTA